LPRQRRLLDDTIAPFDAPFWGAVLLAWAAVALLYARRLYPDPGPAFWLCAAGMELRAAAAAGLTLLIGSALARRFGRRAETALAGAFGLLTLGELAAAALYTVQGLTVSAVLGLMRAPNGAGLRDLKHNGDMPEWSLAAGGALLAAAAAGIVAAAVLGARRAERRRARIGARTVVAIAYAAALLALAEQAGGRSLKTPKDWRLEAEIAPLYVPLWTPRGLAEYRALPAPFRRADLEAAAFRPPRAPRRDALALVVVLESFREDAVSPETTPNLARFRGDAVSFRDADATGNATVLSWYAILGACYPYRLLQAMTARDWAGAPPLSVLRAAGFHSALYASPSMAYFGYRRLLTGADGRLAEIRESDPTSPPYARDREAVDGLLADLRARGRSGRNFYVLFLDATHAPYTWPPDFAAPFKPEGPRFIDAVRARYKNSTLFDDSEFGRVVGELKKLGLYRGAAIAVVGDHGQEFLEHGGLFHGGTLYNELVRVPLYLKLPGAAPGQRPGPASQIDIMPTILVALGLGRGAERFLDGRSLLAGPPRPSLSFNAVNALAPVTGVLANDRWRVEFVLDPGADAEPRRLTVWDVRDRGDRPLAPGGGGAAEDRAFLDREFVPALNATGLLRIEK